MNPDIEASLRLWLDDHLTRPVNPTPFILHPWQVRMYVDAYRCDSLPPGFEVMPTLPPTNRHEVSPEALRAMFPPPPLPESYRDQVDEALRTRLNAIADRTKPDTAVAWIGWKPRHRAYEELKAAVNTSQVRLPTSDELRASFEEFATFEEAAWHRLRKPLGRWQVLSGIDWSLPGT